MKLLFLVVSSLVSLLCIGQSLTLDNTWIAGSKTIYIGVENKLILRGQVDKLLSFQSDRASIERNGDTLVIKPTQTGLLVIVLKTKDETTSHEFTMGYLPRFILIISDNPADTKDISKESVLKAKNIYLLSGKSDIKLFEDYLITECILNIDEKFFQSSVDALTEDVKQAIATLPPGSIIKVQQVTAKSKSTGKEMKLTSNQSFTIL